MNDNTTSLMTLWSLAIEATDYDVRREREIALGAALAEAAWGAQPDGSFVTSCSTHVASGTYTSTLHSPGRRGPLAEVEHYLGRTGWILRAIRTRDEALAIRETERASARSAVAAHEEYRRAVDARLAAGWPVLYVPGQKGGTFALPEEPHRLVSARAAARRAGVREADIPEQNCIFRIVIRRRRSGRHSWLERLDQSARDRAIARAACAA